jgi:hypothetical protein
MLQVQNKSQNALPAVTPRTTGPTQKDITELTQSLEENCNIDSSLPIYKKQDSQASNKLSSS